MIRLLFTFLGLLWLVCAGLLASVALGDSPIGSKTSRCLALNFGNYQYENENWISIDNALCTILDPAQCVPLAGSCQNSGECCEGFCQDGVCVVTESPDLICETVLAECPGGTDCPPPFCNVKCFGALGDGTTDDTVAIQAAMDACAVPADGGYDSGTHTNCRGGGTVYFPRVLTSSGCYRTTATLTGCGVSLLGEGLGASVICPDFTGSCTDDPEDGFQCSPVFQLAGADGAVSSGSNVDANGFVGVIARDLCIHGPVQTVTPGERDATIDGIRYVYNASILQDWAADRVHVAGVNNALIEDGHFQNGNVFRSKFENNYSHIMFLYCDFVQLEDNTYGDAAFAALETRFHCADMRILQSNTVGGYPYFLYSSGSDGAGDFIRNVIFEGMNSTLNVGNGFYFTEQYNDATDEHVTDGMAEGFHVRGIRRVLQNDTHKIAARDADYAFRLGRIYGNNTIDNAGSPPGTPSEGVNAFQGFTQGLLWSKGIYGTVEVQTTAPALVTTTTPGLGLERIILCDRFGLCAPRSIPTLVDLDATPTVEGMVAALVSNSGATVVTAFDGGRIGQRLTLLFTNANTTVTDGGNINLSAAFVSTADDTLTLLFDGTDWQEIARAVN